MEIILLKCKKPFRRSEIHVYYGSESVPNNQMSSAYDWKYIQRASVKQLNVL